MSTEDIRETLRKAREALSKADSGASSQFSGSASVIKTDDPNGEAKRPLVPRELHPGCYPR